MTDRKEFLKTRAYYQEFYYNIDSGYEIFKSHKFNVHDALSDDSIMGLNKSVLHESNHELFEMVRKKRIEIVAQIFDPDSNYCLYLKGIKSRKDNLSLIEFCREQIYVSPEMVCAAYFSFPDVESHEDTKKMAMKQMKKKIKRGNDLINAFKKHLEKYLDEFHNFDDKAVLDRVISELHRPILMIIFHLYECEFYGAIGAIKDMLNIYIPLEFITHYDPKDHHDKELVLV
jgi:hypothetical protein